jgi:hypothetical protein
VFQAFSPIEGGYRFQWLWGRPFEIRFDPEKSILTFAGVLPGVVRGEELESEIKAFLVDIASPERREHRRLDPKRTKVRYSKGDLVFRIVNGDLDYGVQHAMNVVNELFLDVLNLRWRDYLVEHYLVSDE